MTKEEKMREILTVYFNPQLIHLLDEAVKDIMTLIDDKED